MPQLTLSSLIEDILELAMPELSRTEGLTASVIRDQILSGRMVLLANPNHHEVRPTLVGQPSGIKVNANIGTSPLRNDAGKELEKLRVAEAAGADTVMDLSTAGDLNAIRTGMLQATRLPLGTVPLYALAQTVVEAGRDPAEITEGQILAEIRTQAEQGVDFMTVHCGLTMRGAELASRERRLLGIVSRGGSIIARWMKRNGRENPFLTRYDDILDIARKHNVTLSLGDGLRPGAGADAGDAAQWDEVAVLGDLQRRAMQAGVQTMIEGPGHVPMDQVEAQIRTMKRLVNGAPLYVLGPLVTDCAPGYDHIAGAIGGALAVRAGADFLCYLTPAEHLTLPDAEDVRQGVIASRVAAQAASSAMGRPSALAREQAVSEGRRDLDWTKLAEHALNPCEVARRRAEHSGEKECAMCGKFCAIRMLSDV